MTKKESNIILLSVTLCWASSYIFIKDISESLSDFAYLTLTAGIAGLILLIIFHRRLRVLDRNTMLRSGILSFLIAGNMIMEKMGLKYVSSSSASFLASLNIIFVPMILLMFKKLPDKDHVLGIFIIIAGLLVSNGNTISSGSPQGVIFMLCACVFMSVYTILAAEFAKESDPLNLSVLQICFSAVIGFVLWTIEDPMTFTHVEWSNRMLSSIFILAIFSKAYAYIMLMYAEKYADALSVTVIASTEPIVTLTLALLIPNVQGETEMFSVKAVLGASIIAIGAFVSGSGIFTDFLKGRKEKLHRTGSAKPETVSYANDSELTGAISADSSCAKTLSKRKLAVVRFFLTAVPFAVLGALFKVMTLVDGFTEVRPENAIPMVSGLMFGPVGAIGCSVGNLIADFFGTFDLKSVLGCVGNFFAAYIPYRMWYAVSEQKPQSRKWKYIFLYVWCSLVSALACAGILGFGLELFFGIWIENVYKYVLLNNLGFSIALGLPVFILAGSDSIKLAIYEPMQKKMLPAMSKRGATAFLITGTVVMTAIAIGVYAGLHIKNSLVMKVLSMLGAVFIAGVFLLPMKEEIENGTE